MKLKHFLPESILSPAGVKAIDAQLEKAGLLDLAMEAAGGAVAQAAARLAPTGRLLVLAGGGANGGDGLVAARHLLALRRDIEVLALPSQQPLTLQNRSRLLAVGEEVKALTPQTLEEALPRASLVIDGLTGTGFQPPARSPLLELLALLQDARPPLLAIDLPSGLDALSAAPSQPSVQAQHTVTFGGPKPALLYGPAARQVGTVEIASLNIPPAWLEAQALATRPSLAEVASWLPVRPADAYKGLVGHVWVIGGQPGMTGAPALSGLGALRAGAGLVTLHSAAALPLLTPELMVRQHDDLETFSKGVEQPPDAVALGMGLGPEAPALAQTVLSWQIPTVLDADALQPQLAGRGHERCLWTPHPGEAARLLSVSTREIVREPIAAAQALQQRLGGVVVLKGAPSTVAHPGGLWLSRGGHPGMASAGMGDTLAGIIAALLCQGMSPAPAALAAVNLHARAGELAAEQHGYGLLASEVSEHLGQAWRSLVE